MKREAQTQLCHFIVWKRQETSGASLIRLTSTWLQNVQWYKQQWGPVRSPTFTPLSIPHTIRLIQRWWQKRNVLYVKMTKSITWFTEWVVWVIVVGELLFFTFKLNSPFCQALLKSPFKSKWGCVSIISSDNFHSSLKNMRME